MIKFKVDVLAELKNAGFPTAKIRREKILSENTLAALSSDNPNITFKSLNLICLLLRKQPGDLLTMDATTEEKLMFYDMTAGISSTDRAED